MRVPRDQTRSLFNILRSDPNGHAQRTRSRQRVGHIFCTGLGLCDKLCSVHRVIGHAVNVQINWGWVNHVNFSPRHNRSA